MPETQAAFEWVPTWHHLKKPRIRHCSLESAAGWIDWVVDLPGEMFPWPCRTWPDALKAVGDWHQGQLFAVGEMSAANLSPHPTKEER